MRIYFNFLIAIFIFLVTSSAYSAWDGQCLDDCFSSKHDCDYCEWFCRAENSREPYHSPNEYKKCPFTNSNGG